MRSTSPPNWPGSCYGAGRAAGGMGTTGTAMGGAAGAQANPGPAGSRSIAPASGPGPGPAPGPGRAPAPAPARAPGAGRGPGPVRAPDRRVRVSVHFPSGRACGLWARFMHDFDVDRAKKREARPEETVFRLFAGPQWPKDRNTWPAGESDRAEPPITAVSSRPRETPYGPAPCGRGRPPCAPPGAGVPRALVTGSWPAFPAGRPEDHQKNRSACL